MRSVRAWFQQSLDFEIFDHTALHGREVFLFVDLIPVHYLSYLFLENQVQPNASRPAIAFPEGVAMFISTYFSTISSKVLCGMVSIFRSDAPSTSAAQSEVPFGDIHVAELPGELVKIGKEVGVDEGQTPKGPDLDLGYVLPSQTVVGPFVC